MEPYLQTIIICASLFPPLLNAQVRLSAMEPFNENALLMSDQENLQPEALEQLLASEEKKTDLNKAGEEELLKLGLHEKQIKALLSYRQSNGPLTSIYELQVMEEFDLSTLDEINDFITLTNPLALPEKWPKKIFDDKNNYLLLRTGFRIGEEEYEAKNKFSVPNPSVLTRFRSAKPKEYSIGFTMEKDAGESITWNPSSRIFGMDFYSAHVSLENIGRIKHLILGDYTFQTGEGLLFSTGLGLGKSYETILSVKKALDGLKPYISSMEDGFFRGSACTISLSPTLELTTLFSLDAKDATLSWESNPVSFRAINTSGLHKTESEIAGKDQLLEAEVGGSLKYTNSLKTKTFGISCLYTRFSHPQIKPDLLRNYFEFSGNENMAISHSGSINFKNMLLFYEGGLSNGMAFGGVAGTLISLTENIGFSTVLRHYSPSFVSFYAGALKESSRNLNERGSYSGLQIGLRKNLSFSVYMDVFRFPWLKYNIDAPSNGYEYLLFLTWKPVKGYQVRVKFREESKTSNTAGDKLYSVAPRRKYNYMLDLYSEAQDHIKFRTRVQGSSFLYNKQISHGFLLSEDLIFDLGKITISTRAALFDTFDFETRQFVYERDVLYSFSLPSFQGRGLRTYLLFNMKVSKKIDFWLKCSRTTKIETEDTTNTATTPAMGRTTDLRIQLRYKI
ncbi:MAG: helix-hairpin-helix domain-containing protein [Cyclobacteriaceae bacterium]|nr:helix-hairpin-helix domain-containing protein [Cyclobacteriaceae bacterium]